MAFGRRVCPSVETLSPVLVGVMSRESRLSSSSDSRHWIDSLLTPPSSVRAV